MKRMSKWIICFLFAAAVMFITVTYSLVNLAVDLIYAFVDPRVKSQYTKG